MAVDAGGEYHLRSATELRRSPGNMILTNMRKILSECECSAAKERTVMCIDVHNRHLIPFKTSPRCPMRFSRHSAGNDGEHTPF